LPPGVVRELLRPFFEETSVSAGVWGRAAFSAEVLAQAAITGSLLPNVSGGTGFTCTFQYASGFGFGTGFEFLTDLAIPDPKRLCERVSENVTRLVLAEVQRLANDLPPAEADLIRPAAAALRLVLPCSFRSLFSVGLNLAGTVGVNRAGSITASAAVESVLEQAQHEVLRAAIELASRQLAEYVKADAVCDRLLDLAEDDLRSIVAKLEQLRQTLEAVDSTDVHDIERWFRAILACVGAIESVVTSGLIPAPATRQFREALALLWCAGVLLERIVVDSQLGLRGSFDAQAEPPAVTGGVSTYVATRL